MYFIIHAAFVRIKLMMMMMMMMMIKHKAIKFAAMADRMV